jgi:hypothetical protein
LGKFFAKIENVTREPERSLAKISLGRVLHANGAIQQLRQTFDI